MTPVLEIDGIAKTYRSGGARVDALRGVDLEIPRGAVFGLLGPNGAGKSTLLRIVLGLVKASQGSFRLLGAEHIDAAILRRVGALIESPALYPFLTARQTLQLLARTAGFDDPPRIPDLLQRVGLHDAADRRVRSFSLGMKQRLGVAAAMLARPELLILDEPTNGLDPAGIQDMRTLMRQLADHEGVTVILSSHLMEEVQKVCDRVAILNQGAVVAEGAVADLLSARATLLIRATPQDIALRTLGPAARLQGETIAIEAERDAVPGLVRQLVAAGADVHEVRWTAQSLEQLFLSVTAS